MVSVPQTSTRSPPLARGHSSDRTPIDTIALTSRSQPQKDDNIPFTLKYAPDAYYVAALTGGGGGDHRVRGKIRREALAGQWRAVGETCSRRRRHSRRSLVVKRVGRRYAHAEAPLRNDLHTTPRRRWSRLRRLSSRDAKASIGRRLIRLDDDDGDEEGALALGEAASDLLQEERNKGEEGSPIQALSLCERLRNISFRCDELEKKLLLHRLWLRGKSEALEHVVMKSEELLLYGAWTVLPDAGFSMSPSSHP